MLIKQIFHPTEQLRSSIAFFSDAVKAGFPSPAQDYIEKTLSLDDLCIRTPAATYFVRASGSSMERAGIHDGDVLVVDRSLPPGHRKIVIASVDGEFVCKRLDLSVPTGLCCGQKAKITPTSRFGRRMNSKSSVL